MKRATAVTLLQHRWLLTGEEKRDQVTRRTVALQCESHNELALHVSRQRGNESNSTILNLGSSSSVLTQRVGDGKQKTGTENRPTRQDSDSYRLSRRRTVFPAENNGNFPVVERQIGHDQEVERQAHIQRVLIKERSKGSDCGQSGLELLGSEKEKTIDREAEDKKHKEKEKSRERGRENEKDKEKSSEGRGREKDRRSSSSAMKEHKDKNKQEILDKEIDKSRQESYEHTQEISYPCDNNQLHGMVKLNLKNDSVSTQKTDSNPTVSVSTSTAPSTILKSKSELSEKLSDRISLKPSYDSDASPRSSQVDMQFECSGDADAEMFRLIEFK